MDAMALLDMERRTGISHREVDDFALRMDMISEVMEQIKAGTFDPENCAIPGYKSPEQEAREAAERARRVEEKRCAEEQKRRQEQAEEQESWWSRARLRFSVERGGEEEEEEEEEEAEESKAAADQWANRVLAAYKARDANDYSVWDAWVPEDPATLEEKALREAALEKVRNAQFETSNPDFCRQFKQDLEKRQQTQRTREREAEKFKLQGNRHYKRREYALANAQYMKALEKAPFSAAVLTNIAQCHLRLDALDDSVEFSTRALYVNPDHVKALSRRAAVWHRQKKWKEAAEDMAKALRLDPQNEDVVEQHSIVAGDYEDAVTRCKLEAKMKGELSMTSAKQATSGGGAVAEDLLFLTELLAKMNERETEIGVNQAETIVLPVVNEAWTGYELLIPILEKTADARDLMRTSGEIDKLKRRLLAVFQSLLTLVGTWTASENEADSISTMASRVQEMTVVAMVRVLAACLTNSPRNQIVLYRDAVFRSALMALLVGSEEQQVADLPPRLLEMVLRAFEEAVDAKSWKKEIIACPAAVSTLLAVIAHPIEVNQTSGIVEASTKAALSASSILFTISGDNPHGIKALASDSTCLSAVADGLQAQRRSTATLSNLLGVLTNLSTSLTVRAALGGQHSSTGADIPSVRPRLVRLLIVLASHFTKSTLSLQKRAAYQVCAERALAALLNFTFQSDSLVRGELVTHGAGAAIRTILDFVASNNVNELVLIVSRAVSLLCRLHSLPGGDAETSLHGELASTELLDQLYKICQLSLPSFAAASTGAAPIDLWQTHAQVWCHVGWCVSVSRHEHRVRSYLLEKQAVPAMVETLSLVNAQRLYHRASSDPATGPERIAGNVVKVLIAMLPRKPTDGDCDHHFWTRKSTLKVLVDALQGLPDGLARKNVAILLAKLCQVYGDTAKEKLRELRGIEMMLSVSKSLQTPHKTAATTIKPNAVAF